KTVTFDQSMPAVLLSARRKASWEFPVARMMLAAPRASIAARSISLMSVAAAAPSACSSAWISTGSLSTSKVLTGSLRNSVSLNSYRSFSPRLEAQAASRLFEHANRPKIGWPSHLWSNHAPHLLAGDDRRQRL